MGEMAKGEMFSCLELKVSALQLSCDFSVSVDKPAYELILSYSRDTGFFLLGFLLNPFLKKKKFLQHTLVISISAVENETF